MSFFVLKTMEYPLEFLVIFKDNYFHQGAHIQPLYFVVFFVCFYVSSTSNAVMQVIAVIIALGRELRKESRR